MNADGTDKRQLTRLGAMSWAPYFHPSGDYLIFTTNLHGFANFELYLVDAEGREGAGAGDPHRRLRRPAGLHPRRQAAGLDQQPHRGQEGPDLHRRLGRREGPGAPGARAADLSGKAPPSASAAPDRSGPQPRDHPRGRCAARRDLASDAMEGRLTGTAGEAAATEYVAEAFEAIGPERRPATDGYFQPFEFTSGVDAGRAQRLSITLADGSETRAGGGPRLAAAGLQQTGLGRLRRPGLRRLRHHGARGRRPAGLRQLRRPRRHRTSGWWCCATCRRTSRRSGASTSAATPACATRP